MNQGQHVNDFASFQKKFEKLLKLSSKENAH
jgi:hypothetical protein